MKIKNKVKIGGGKSNTHQAFWVVVGYLSTFSLGIVSSAILSRYFSKAEYGTYKQIIYVYTTLLIIFTGGLPEVFAYFLPRHSLNQGKNIVWKVSKTLFLGGAVFSFFLYVFSGVIAKFLNNPELEKGLKAFSPIPFLLLPTLGIEGIFSAYKKTFLIGIYNTLTRVLMLLFIVLPVVLFNGTYISAIYGWVIVSIVSLLIAFYFKSIPFKTVVPEKSLLTYKEIFEYSLPLLAASLWGIAIRSADQFYISRFFGPKVFAEFSNGFIQLPFVSMITGAASVVLLPVFSKMVHEKADLTELANVWRNAILKSAIIIYPILAFFIFYADSIVLILFSKVYSGSIIYFRISMLYNFFNIIIFAPILLALGKIRFYARLHMWLAFSIWILEYFSIVLFHSPVSVAVISISIGIVNVLVGIVYVSNVLHLSLQKLIPFRNITIILLHVFTIIFIVKYGTDRIGFHSKKIEMLLAFLTYGILLISTSRFLKINYLNSLKFVFRIK